MADDLRQLESSKLDEDERIALDRALAFVISDDPRGKALDDVQAMRFAAEEVARNAYWLEAARESIADRSKP